MARYRNGLILLLLFLVLLAVVLLTQGGNSSTTTTAATTATPDPKAQLLQILNIPAADRPTKIEVKETTPAKSVAFKYENNKWLLDSSTAIELDTMVVASAIDQFNNLKGTTLVTDKGDNLANYGLDKLNLIITLNSPTLGNKVINVGEQNPATKAYYVKLENDLRVWAVAPGLIEQAKGWLEKLPIPVPTPTPFPTIDLSPLPSLVPSGTPGSTTTSIPITSTVALTSAPVTSTVALTSAPVTSTVALTSAPITSTVALTSIPITSTVAITSATKITATTSVPISTTAVAKTTSPISTTVAVSPKPSVKP
ncbi:MAG: DUF4340 domain-containing protein [Chloroflexota bacterium]